VNVSTTRRRVEFSWVELCRCKHPFTNTALIRPKTQALTMQLNKAVRISTAVKQQ